MGYATAIDSSLSFSVVCCSKLGGGGGGEGGNTGKV